MFELGEWRIDYLPQSPHTQTNPSQNQGIPPPTYLETIHYSDQIHHLIPLSQPPKHSNGEYKILASLTGHRALASTCWQRGGYLARRLIESAFPCFLPGLCCLVMSYALCLSTQRAG
jgi:hypothetical protein